MAGSQDLDILFQKHLDDLRLVLTCNLYDPLKNGDSFYLARVIDFVLERTNGRNSVRLLTDVTKRCKKTMCNVGFVITNA